MDDEPVVIPVTDELDLHIFNPKDVKDLLTEYITACCEKGIKEVRLIHGKGKGNMRRTVYSVLRSLPEVLSFHLAGDSKGSWGATIAVLEIGTRKEE